MAPDIVADVVVVGSGGAGLTAALSARHEGADTVVIERSELIGGTTSVSGGVLWVPANPYAQEVGVTDTRDEALAYMAAVAGDSVERAMLEALVDSGTRMLRFIEAATPARFTPLNRAPDYRQDFAGAKLAGRALDNQPFEAKSLGDWARRIRISPHYPSLTLAEMKGSVYDPGGVPWALAGERMRDDVRTLGSALVCGIFAGCLSAGIPAHMGLRARRLIRSSGRVDGLECTTVDGRKVEVAARRAIVLASGGFEWNDTLKDKLLGTRDVLAASPPTNEGDGLLMAMQAGAAISHLTEGWWEPVCGIPGECWPEGPPLFRLNIAERTLPGSILVNTQGRRFVNEAMNYHDLTRIMLQVDIATNRRPNNPAWMIFDESFRRKYAVLTAMPDFSAPKWLISAPDLESLAGQLACDAETLVRTLDTFNGYAEAGDDLDFGRGSSAYDLYHADPRHGPNPSLGPIAEPPFYALRTYAGLVGTKGGPRIDPQARVLDFDGEPIEGLFACGNVAAGAVTGVGLAGPGATLGPTLTMGYIAGSTAARAGA